MLAGICAAPRWADAVAGGRPYRSVVALQDAAASALLAEDLDDALTGHPRIGDRTADGRSGAEHARVREAGDEVLVALARGNAEYERRFGLVYLVCAAGHSAEALLATLRARLDHDPETERTVALDQLAAINRRRLADLLTGRAARGTGRPGPGSGRGGDR